MSRSQEVAVGAFDGRTGAAWRRILRGAVATALAASLVHAEGEQAAPPSTPASASRSDASAREPRSPLRDIGGDAIYLLSFPARTNRRGAAHAGIVVGGALLLVLLDDEIRERVQRERSASLDRWESRIEPFGRAEVTGGAALTLLAFGELSDRERLAETGRTLVEALAFTEVLKSAAKGLTGREPPDPGVRADEFFAGGTIFPSGHTARAFAFATVIAERHGRVPGTVAYALATLVGLFRIENDSHWASDVLVGAALGHVVAKCVHRRRLERAARRPLEIAPVLSPAGVGLTARIRF